MQCYLLRSEVNAETLPNAPSCGWSIWFRSVSAHTWVTRRVGMKRREQRSITREETEMISYIGGNAAKRGCHFAAAAVSLVWSAER